MVLGMCLLLAQDQEFQATPHPQISLLPLPDSTAYQLSNQSHKFCQFYRFSSLYTLCITLYDG